MVEETVTLSRKAYDALVEKARKSDAKESELKIEIRKEFQEKSEIGENLLKQLFDVVNKPEPKNLIQRIFNK